MEVEQMMGATGPEFTDGTEEEGVGPDATNDPTEPGKDHKRARQQREKLPGAEGSKQNPGGDAMEVEQMMGATGLTFEHGMEGGGNGATGLAKGRSRQSMWQAQKKTRRKAAKKLNRKPKKN